MDLTELWDKALKKTEIIRPRLKGLSSVAATRLPYLFLGESSVNKGDTVVRRGEVVVNKPAVILPNHLPQFEGFDFEKDLHYQDDTVLNFLLVRGVSFPSLRYDNQTSSVDVYEGRLTQAIKFFSNRFQKQEDMTTTLLAGPEDAWQFSVLIFIGIQAAKSADGDIRTFLEEWRRRGRLS